MAEREGFEPSVPVKVRIISNDVHSATLSPFHRLLQVEQAKFLCVAGVRNLGLDRAWSRLFRESTTEIRPIRCSAMAGLGRSLR